MEQDNIFQLIRTVEQFTNESILRWSKSFRLNVGISSILVLSELKSGGPQKQTELANKLGYTPGALTNIANKLLELGLATRKPDASDRRIIRLAITGEGRELLKEAQEKGQWMKQELFSVLTEEEIAQFLRIHEKLLNNIRRND